MSTVQIPEEQRLRLSLIPWNTYVAYSDGLGPRHIRVTYDRGEMEVMTLSPKHENRKKLLGRLVDALTEEMEIDIASGGSMTCRRERLLRALEPDECFWIEHEPEVRGRQGIDLEVDPPPDLALEFEISRSTMNRMAIYAALRVPEVWRWNGETLSVHLLTARPLSAERAEQGVSVSAVGRIRWVSCAHGLERDAADTVIPGLGEEEEETRLGETK